MFNLLTFHFELDDITLIGEIKSPVLNFSSFAGAAVDLKMAGVRSARNYFRASDLGSV